MARDFSIAVFAHNEERSIANALRSIIAAADGLSEFRITVLANGCTDDTRGAVRRFAAREPRVQLVEIALGDKCNAWNTYVYDLLDDSPAQFFMDGDVRCSSHAIATMRAKLLASDHATAIAGVPCSGRSRLFYQTYIEKWGWLYGNLYGVKRTQLQNLVAAGLRLPLGLRGNDHFITRFMHSDLAPPWAEDRRRVIFDPNAGYLFDRLMPFRPRDIRLYYRRRVIYRWRELQLALIAEIPLTNLPPDMTEVNRRIREDLEQSKVGWRDFFAKCVLKRLQNPETVVMQPPLMHDSGGTPASQPANQRH